MCIVEIKYLAENNAPLNLTIIIFLLLHSIFAISLIIDSEKLKNVFIDSNDFFANSHCQKMGLAKTLFFVSLFILLFDRISIFANLPIASFLRDLIIVRCMMYLSYLDNEERPKIEAG